MHLYDMSLIVTAGSAPGRHLLRDGPGHGCGSGGGMDAPDAARSTLLCRQVCLISKTLSTLPALACTNQCTCDVDMAGIDTYNFLYHALVRSHLSPVMLLIACILLRQVQWGRGTAEGAGGCGRLLRLCL